MGNLEKAGIAVVVVLLTVIMVVAFVTDPGTEGGAAPGDRTTLAPAGLAAHRTVDSRAADPTIDGGDLIQDVTPRAAAADRAPRRREAAAPRRREAPAGGSRLRRSPRGRPVAGGGPASTTDRGTTEAAREVPPVRPKTSPPGAPSPAPQHARSAEVRPGDSPWKIAEREYGPRLAARMAAAIVKENGIKDPLRLRPGTKLRLPPAPVASGSRREPASGQRRASITSSAAPAGGVGLPPFDPGPAAPAGAASPAGGDNIYIVKHGDVLSRIAQRELGSWKLMFRIMELNGIKEPDRIREGMRLKMPPRTK